MLTRPARRVVLPAGTAEPGLRASLVRQPRWWLVLIIALGVGLPLLVAAMTGNLTIPHNDSWAFTRITRTFWQTGRIRLLNFDEMSLVGQLFLVGPLGTSIVAEQIGVAIAGAIAVWCCYELTATVTTPQRGLFAAALLVLWPGFASLTTSFMTDIPALAASWAALLAGRRALQRDSRGMLLLSLAIGFWGFTVREMAALAPAAVVIVGLCTHRTRSSVSVKYLLSLSTVPVLLGVAFIHWREGMPNGQNPHLVLDLSQLPSTTLLAVESVYFTIAMFLAPVVLLMARPARWSRASWIWVALVAAAATSMILRHYQLTVGGYFGPAGEYSYVMPLFRHVIPTELWDLVRPIAILSGLLMAGELAKNWRHADPTLAVFTGLAYLSVVFLAVTSTPMISRYLLPLLPGVAALVLVGRRNSLRALRPSDMASRSEFVSSPVLAGAGLVSLLVLAAISAILALNAFAFDRARWTEASNLVASGIPADRVDGGPEWDGWQSPNGVRRYSWATYARGYFGSAPTLYPIAPCIVMTTSRLPAGNSPVDRGHSTLLARHAYHTLLATGESYLYVYATHMPSCPRVAEQNA